MQRGPKTAECRGTAHERIIRTDHHTCSGCGSSGYRSRPVCRGAGSGCREERCTRRNCRYRAQAHRVRPGHSHSYPGPVAGRPCGHGRESDGRLRALHPVGECRHLQQQLQRHRVPRRDYRRRLHRAIDLIGLPRRNLHHDDRCAAQCPHGRYRAGRGLVRTAGNPVRLRRTGRHDAYRDQQAGLHRVLRDFRW